MNIIRRTLRLLDLYTQLRSYRLEMWQPQNCAVAGRNYWMPHGQKASTQDLKENSTYIDELWEARHPELLRPCSAIHKSIIY